MDFARRALRQHLNTFVWWTALLAMVGLTVMACGARPAGPSASGDRLRVVATTTVLADLVAQTGGDLVEVRSLVPKGGEVHTFDPSPSDAIALAEADLVVMNGLGLDDWLRDLAASAGRDVPIVELAVDLQGVEYLAPAKEAAKEGAEHAAESANPHLWLNVAYARKYVERISATLKEVDPGDAAGYDASAATYLQRLTDLEAWVNEQMSRVPDERRRVVSFHEAFPYFAAAYGIDIVDTVIDAPGQEPSAGDVTALIDTIRRGGIVAIFAEPQFPSDLTETIAQETGVAVVTDLFNDSLAEPPVDSYEGLIRWDVERIVGALTTTQEGTRR